jgi:Phage tail baseplate hub (GPD)
VSTYQVLIDGNAVDDGFYDAIGTLEVEENAHLPDALRLVLPVTTDDSDLTWVGDQKVRPYANIAVVVTPDGGAPSCVFDGYVLSHMVHLEAGVTASTVEVRAQDASVLMSLEHKTREWAGLTEGAVANQVFAGYGFTPAGPNTTDDSLAHASPGHTLMQRGTDLEFLRRLARRSGRWCRVTCTDRPGVRTGYFAVPDLSASPATTIVLNDPETASVPSLEFHWDVARPTKVLAGQASLREFAGKDSSVRLTTPGDTADLPVRARAVLREAGWFAGCTGTAEMSRLQAVLRVGTVAAVSGAGTLLSGNYLVTGVRHSISTNNHTMAFTMARNAVGPAAGPDGGPPSIPGGLG